MWALRPTPPLLIKPPLNLLSSIIVFNSNTTTNRFIFVNSFRRSIAKSFSSSTTMEGVKAKATAATDAELSSTEHVTGNWFSVPELRLRDHRFSVPLDYSLDHATSPKISIFAREVVAGMSAIL